MRIKIQKEVNVSEYQKELFEKGEEVSKYISTVFRNGIRSHIQNNFEQIKKSISEKDFQNDLADSLNQIEIARNSIIGVLNGYASEIKEFIKEVQRSDE